MTLKDSGYGGLKTQIKRDGIDLNDSRLSSINRVLEQWIPGLSGQLTCMSYRVLFPALTRGEQLASLRIRLPQLYDENSPLQSCVQIGGSLKVLGDLPEHALVQRESVSELLSDRLHRRTKQIRLQTRSRYLADAACFIKESIEIHYRLKPPLICSGLLETEYSPDLFDCNLYIDETRLFSYMSLQLTPQRASIDYVYATQNLGCPGLLVPVDVVGLLLLSLCQQHLPERQCMSFDYHVYGQLYTRQPVRLCGAVIDGYKILMWAESEGYLLYRGILKLN